MKYRNKSIRLKFDIWKLNIKKYDDEQNFNPFKQ